MKKITSRVLNLKLLRFSVFLILACGILAGIEWQDAEAGLGLVALMSVPLLPFAQSVRSGLIDKKAYLEELKFRARALQPAAAARVGAILAKMEENLKPENEQRLKDLIIRARTDAEAKAELAKLRIVTVDNFLTATSNPIAFFDEVKLENNEVPYIENTSKQEIIVSYLGQDGRARKTQPIKYQDAQQIDLHTLSTEEYEYQLMDIYKGDVKTPSMANIDMAYDYEMQVNKLMWPFVFRSIGAFTLTGARANRVYVPHSYVNVKNLPITNLLVPAGNTTTSLFRKECLDAILDYCAAWGNNAFRDGQLKPVAVYIPSSEAMGWTKQITLTSQPNTKVEEIFQYGFILTYGGVTWQFIADATLDPDAGRAYVKFNKPIGTYFTKPGMDKTFTDESIEMQKQNKGSVSMQKVVGWGLPVTGRVAVAAVQYHTAR